MPNQYDDFFQFDFILLCQPCPATALTSLGLEAPGIDYHSVETCTVVRQFCTQYENMAEEV